MAIDLHISAATPAELQDILNTLVGEPAPAAVVTAAKATAKAPKAAKAATKPAPEPEPEQPAEETDAVDDLGLGDDEPEVEVIDKAKVAAELRAFITKKGDKGAPEAYKVLVQFGAKKFDELKEADYSKFLSKLKAAA